MKALFLDIDGVLNTDRDVRKYGKDYINPTLVDYLKFIILSTNASIILSSTWRLLEESKKIVEKSLYLKRLYILDSTPCRRKESSQWVPRSEEINEWLLKRPQIKNFAIIDDNNDAGLNLESNFFQTDSDIGLTINIAERVIEHLNK